MADYKNPIELRKLAQVMNQALAKEALFEAADEIERLLATNKVLGHIGALPDTAGHDYADLAGRLAHVERELRDMGMQIEGLRGRMNHNG